MYYLHCLTITNVFLILENVLPCAAYIYFNFKNVCISVLYFNKLCMKTFSFSFDLSPILTKKTAI